jgi:hypothetical protein
MLGVRCNQNGTLVGDRERVVRPGRGARHEPVVKPPGRARLLVIRPGGAAETRPAPFQGASVVAQGSGGCTTGYSPLSLRDKT